MQENKDLLYTGGYRVTNARNIILEVLEFANKPLTVQDIHKESKKKITCDMATIYRNLNAMTEKSIVLEKYLCHKHAHYELASDPHSYIVCKYCEHIEELPDFGGEEMSKKLFKKAKKFKAMTGFSFEIYGICNGCKKGSVAR